MPFDIEEKPEEELYEHILEKSTFTRYRFYIMICMVFVFIADGMEMTIFNFIIQPFGDYFGLDESDIETQITTSSLFLGIAIGCTSASFITNKIGRILSIHISNIILFISHLVNECLVKFICFYYFKMYFRLSFRHNYSYFYELFSESIIQ